jgi:hypothetical protein
LTEEYPQTLLLSEEYDFILSFLEIILKNFKILLISIERLLSSNSSCVNFHVGLDAYKESLWFSLKCFVDVICHFSFGHCIVYHLRIVASDYTFSRSMWEKKRNYNRKILYNLRKNIVTSFVEFYSRIF